MHNRVYYIKLEEEQRFAALVRILYGYEKPYLEVMEDM